MFDVDHSNRLNESEVYSIVDSLLGHLSRTRDRKRLTKKLFALMDTDGDNLITPEEFTRTALSYQPLNSALLGMWIPIYSKVNPYSRKILLGESAEEENEVKIQQEGISKRNLMIRAGSTQYLGMENTILSSPNSPRSMSHPMLRQNSKNKYTVSVERWQNSQQAVPPGKVIMNAFTQEAVLSKSPFTGSQESLHSSFSELFCCSVLSCFND